MIDVLMTPSKAYRGRCDHQLLAAGREHPKNSRKRAPGPSPTHGALKGCSGIPGPTTRVQLIDGLKRTKEQPTSLPAGAMLPYHPPLPVSCPAGRNDGRELTCSW